MPQTEDIMVRDFNLSEYGEALVGFQGELGNYVKSLGIYKVVRIDQKDKAVSKRGRKASVMKILSNISDMNVGGVNNFN